MDVLYAKSTPPPVVVVVTYMSYALLLPLITIILRPSKNQLMHFSPQNRICTLRIKDGGNTAYTADTVYAVYTVFNTTHTIQTALHRLNSSTYAYIHC